MKKNLLSLSITAAIAGLTLAGAANAAVSIAGTGATGAGATLTATDATALRLADGGIGHIGIIPYFSTQNGNQTLFSVTNTDTDNGKAVKIRFRSAANSDDIFDFTLFLSPGDVWTANISRDATTGISRLVTTDNSCTLPALNDVNRGFVTARLPAVSTTFTAEQQASWTREGYVEVLNMADIPRVFATGQTSTAYDAGGSKNNALYATTKHNAAGAVACDAAVLGKLVNNVPQTAAGLSALGLDTPSGGLYTTAFIINTANAFLSWSTEATAVAATTDANSFTSARGKLVFAPQTAAPFTGDLAALSADPLFTTAAQNGGVVLPPSEFDFPDLSTSYTNGSTTAAAQAEALANSLAVTSIKNDYSSESAIGSKTDFTFSLPTRRYAVAVDYSTLTSTNPSVPTLRFNTANARHFTSANTTLQGLLACVSPGTGAVTGYSRSEQALSSGAVISPSPISSLRLCGEVSVLTVNNDGTSPAGKGVLASSVAVQNVFTSFQNGWINIATPGATAVNGLPVLGSAYTSAIGAPAGGVSTNFAWTYAHKFIRAALPVAP